jgi:hypothetical protein
MQVTDVAIVGVGAKDYYRRGESWPRTVTELAGSAILAACEDAGLSARDIDGFAYSSGAKSGDAENLDTAFMETLGIPEVTFSAALTSGGGSAGAIGLARAAIVAGDANVVVTVMALQQAARRGRPASMMRSGLHHALPALPRCRRMGLPRRHP